MSKEEYANEIKRLAYHYNKGKEDERERIIKLIDDTEEEIKKHITEDEDGLIDYGVSHLANTLREKLQNAKSKNI